MTSVLTHPHGTSLPNPRKHSKTEKEIQNRDDKDKLLNMIDLFYDKVNNKIDKALSKDHKKTTLACKQLLTEIALHPKQESYEISRLSDQFFNEMGKLNNVVSSFLTSMESLRIKISKELHTQQLKSNLKQEKQSAKEYNIAVLRRINFKKQKTSLSQKLKDILTLNKKLVKIEADPEEEENGCSLEIDGKKIEAPVHRYKKIEFEGKKKEYLLCLCRKKENRQGQLFLYNDKLQTIASFGHLPPINLQTFLDIVQIGNYLFIAHTHQIMRINLTNDLDLQSTFFAQRINKIDYIDQTLVVWAEDSQFNHSILFLTNELTLFHQLYLRTNIKSISKHFKITRTHQQLFFIGRTLNGSNDLFKISNMEIQLAVKDIGPVDEIVECPSERKNNCVLMRRGGELYRFTSSKMSQKLIQIDLDNGDSMKRCCILGEHFYSLHQSGKYLLQCHFNLPRNEDNPQP